MQEVTEDLIHAYVDNQLNQEEMRKFEKLLQEDSNLAEKVIAYQTLNSQLHELFDPVLSEEIPNSISVQQPVRKARRSFFNFAASLLLLFTGGLSGWYLKDVVDKKQELLVTLVQPATYAHVVYVPEVKHPVEVTADQEKHLVKWLSKRLGNNINAPNLIEFGFQLVGGRLLPSKHGPAAQFMYENTSGDRLTLYVQSNEVMDKNTAFRYSETESTRSFYWIDGKLGYVLSGNTSKSQLLDTAHSVYQQLSFN